VQKENPKNVRGDSITCEHPDISGTCQRDINGEHQPPRRQKREGTENKHRGRYLSTRRVNDIWRSIETPSRSNDTATPHHQWKDTDARDERSSERSGIDKSPQSPNGEIVNDSIWRHGTDARRDCELRANNKKELRRRSLASSADDRETASSTSRQHLDVRHLGIGNGLSGRTVWQPLHPPREMSNRDRTSDDANATIYGDNSFTAKQRRTNGERREWKKNKGNTCEHGWQRSE